MMSVIAALTCGENGLFQTQTQLKHLFLLFKNTKENF